PQLIPRKQGTAVSFQEAREFVLYNPQKLQRLNDLDGVFGGLHWANFQDLPGWLRLEHRRLLGEGIDARALRRRRLLDHDELGIARQQENAGLFQLLIADGCERLDERLHVLLRQLSFVGDLLNELRFG